MNLDKIIKDLINNTKKDCIEEYFDDLKKSFNSTEAKASAALINKL